VKKTHKQKQREREVGVTEKKEEKEWQDY